MLGTCIENATPLAFEHKFIVLLMKWCELVFYHTHGLHFDDYIIERDSMLIGILTMTAFICFLISHRTRSTTREREWRAESVGVSIGVHRVPRRRKGEASKMLG